MNRAGVVAVMLAGAAWTLPAGFDPLDAGLLRAAAAALRPRPCTLPSAWAAKHVNLTAAMGVTEPGPFDPGYLPWQRSILDTRVEFPAYRGWVAPKLAQAGVTWAVLPTIAQHIAEGMGNVLYLLGREADSDKIARDRFSELAKIPVVAERMGTLEEDSRKDSGTSYPFDSGTVLFATAGSVSALSSTTYPVIVIDEFDQCEAAFLKGGKYGALLPFAEARQGRVFGGGYTCILSHPTDYDRGIAVVFETKSTQHRWVFDCPSCAGPCDLTSACVKFEVFDTEGRPDARHHRVVCPRCRKTVTDAQRKAAVWEKGTRPGASGRWWTPLADADCTPDQRPLLGRMVNGLMDPHKPSAHFARLLASCWGKPQETKSTLNTHFGEWVKPASNELSEDRLKEMLDFGEQERPALPGGPMGAHFLGAGTDVQMPKENPTLLVAVGAAMGNGEVWITDMRRVGGWAAYNAMLGRIAVPRVDGRPLSVEVEGIDSNYLTGQVMSNCRLAVFTPAAQYVERLPVGFSPSSALNRDVQSLMRSDKRRTDASRPELGPIDAYDLFRHHWVDLVLQMVDAGRVRFACPLTGVGDIPSRAEVEAHFRSQWKRVKKASSGWEKPDPEWDLIKDQRDDWLMAVVYMVAAMFLGRTRLGALSERVYELTQGSGQAGIVGLSLGNHRRR